MVKEFEGLPGHAPRERVSWNVDWQVIIDRTKGHAPRERVSWNKEPEKPDCYPKGVTLHVSVWVEIFIDFYSNFFALRHAPRERVSWNAHTSAQIILLCGHAPRERVSWNTKEIL